MKTHESPTTITTQCVSAMKSWPLLKANNVKRDEMKLPDEGAPVPSTWTFDPVREGLHHYYNRDREALEKLLRYLRDRLTDKEKDDV